MPPDELNAVEVEVDVELPPRRGFARLWGGRRGGAFLAVTATGIATQAVTALSGPFQARMLGPHGRGQMVLVLLVALMSSQLGVGGLPAAIAHEVARADMPARDVVRIHMRRWLALSPLPGLLAACAVALLLHTASNWPVFAALGFFLTTAYVWQIVLYAMVQGERNVTRVNIFHLAGLSLYTLCVLSLYLFHRTKHPLLLIALLMTSIAIGLVVGFVMLRRPTGRTVDPRHAAALNSFARRSWLSGIGLLDSLGLDILAVGILLGQTTVGLYAVAVSATNLTTIVLSGIAQVLLPRLAASASAEHAGAMLQRWLLASLAISVLCVGGLELVIGPVMRFAFGPKFTGIIGAAHILIVAWGILGFRRILTTAAQSQGRAAYASKVELGSLGVMLVAVVVTAELFGVNGVAFSVGGAGLLACAALLARIDFATDAS